MAEIDIQEAVLERRLTELEADVAALKRSLSWWHQFSATALPIMFTLVVSVFAMIAVQNGRFDELSKRIDNVETRLSAVENDVKQLAITQTETRTLVSETRTRVGGLEDEVKKLAAGQETLEDEVKKLAAGQEIVRDEVKKLSTGQESLRALIEERLPKPAR